MAQKKDTIVIIDGNALLHRAWHAIPHLATSDGLMVNAVYGWMMIFLKMYETIKPKYIAVTFDVKGKTFRHELFDEYKAQRKKKPQELYDQIGMIKDLLVDFDIPVYEIEGFEADDVIGSLCRDQQIDNDQVLSIVLTGDMDALQLVDENTHVFAPKIGLSQTKEYDIEAVKEKYGGLLPHQLIDYKALRGDSSDNIPGVRGIGEKTAIKLLSVADNLEDLYTLIEVEPEKLEAAGVKQRIINLLAENKEQALLAKELVTIVTDVSIPFKLEDCLFDSYDRQKVAEKMRRYEFRSLLNRLPELKKQVESDTNQASLFDAPVSTDNSGKAGETLGIIYKDTYYLVDTAEKLTEAQQIINNYTALAFDTETTGLNVWQDELLGVSICGKPGEAFYFTKNEENLTYLKAILENPDIKKYAHNAKFDISVLSRYDILVAPLSFDTMIASYLVNSGSSGNKLDTLVFNRIGHEMIPIEQLIGKKGKNQKTLSDINIEIVAQYAAEDADYTFQLVEILHKELEEKELLDLFYNIEMPLISVLFSMERHGCLLDTQFLHRLSTDITQKLEVVDVQIYKLAGREFNINSPAQLQEVLFNDLHIPADNLKKTKKGISTAASELEKIREEHEIIDLISQHRELAKLKSTYVDALPSVADENSRVHTQFNQTIAATGRLSSSNPNLQNIPIRTELGAQIRQAFIAPERYSLVAADYSQVELRVIAALSADPNMVEGFKQGLDIHQATAAKIYDISLDEVTKEQRYSAKAINFGVIYGLGPFGLARNIGISRVEAKEFIDKYFEIYSDVKLYLESQKVFAQENGYITTLFGRRRYLPDINSGVPMVRAAAERMAINAPVQGTAADLMKIAMIDVYTELPEKFPLVKMILQVHDELVFEVPDNQIDEFGKWIKNIMENVHKFEVPIIVDAEYGKNWGQLQYITVD